jgi:hypothetical protein
MTPKFKDQPRDDDLEVRIRYIDGRYVGTLKAHNVILMVTGKSEQECAEKLLQRYGEGR